MELFFCLSGFIFFHLYADPIAQRKISAREFAWLRLSRLYPLHFATLLLTALGQALMIAKFGAPFVYAENDGTHFALHLLFASSWGFERGLSFDGPAWSISVEMLLYGGFFLLCLLRVRQWWQLLALIAAGYLLLWTGPIHDGRGVMSFFIGGLVCGLFHRCWQKELPRWAIATAATPAAILWLGQIWDFPRAQLLDLAAQTHAAAGPGRDYPGFLLLQIAQYFNELLLFPLTILALTLVEARRGQLFTACSFLGDLSYSTYLLHFPLQLGAVLLCRALGIDRTIFRSPLSFVAFFGVLLVLAWCSYTFLERPAQSWLRAKFARAR